MQPFILFIHHIWGEIVLFITHRPRTECGVSQFFKTNCIQSMFRTINRGLLANRSKNFQNHSYGQPALISSASCQCGRVFKGTLTEFRSNIITNLLLLFFCYLMVSIITICNLIKRLIRATFLSISCKRCSWTMKTNATDKRLKLQERLLTINKRNIIRWNIYRDNNFHSRRQVLKCL